MKKNEKVLIGVLVLILIVYAVVIYVLPRVQKKDYAGAEANSGYSSGKVEEGNTPKELQRMVMINGELYYDTGEESKSLRCGVMDGKITSNVPRTEAPKENNQANFEGDYGYQYGNLDTIEIKIDDKWMIFRANGKTFSGIIKEVKDNTIYVEPNQGESERMSADLLMIGVDKTESSNYKARTRRKNYI